MLDLDDTHVGDVSGLNTCINLHMLDLDDTHVSNVSGFAIGIPSIQHTVEFGSALDTPQISLAVLLLCVTVEQPQEEGPSAMVAGWVCHHI